MAADHVAVEPADVGHVFQRGGAGQDHVEQARLAEASFRQRDDARGASDAALRRAVLHGDAWHPIRIRVDWLRDSGLPRLRQIAEKEGRPVPALCPRIRLRLTDGTLADDARVAGEGSLDQVRADLEALQALGATYLLLDTYADDPEATRDPEVALRMVRTLAERVLDLPRSR